LVAVVRGEVWDRLCNCWGIRECAVWLHLLNVHTVSFIGSCSTVTLTQRETAPVGHRQCDVYSTETK